jgi:segregation and condensation protein A
MTGDERDTGVTEAGDAEEAVAEGAVDVAVDAPETDAAPATEAPDAAPAGDSAVTSEPAGSRPAHGVTPGAAMRPDRPGVMVKLERFEGPLDLLLHLIKRDEIDIYDIPIAHIMKQYLAYIELMRALDLDIAGEFLVMAATLMRIKSKMLLPTPAVGEEEDEGDPREELVQRLVEYRQFKEAAGTLKEKEEERRHLFERGMVPGDDEAGPLPLAPATLFDLLDALNRVMARLPEQNVYEVQAELYDVDDKMSLIAKLTAERGSISFVGMLTRCRSRSEMVVTFIALLELIKLGQVTISQPDRFSDILILYSEPEGSDDRVPVEPAGSD